MGFNQSQRGAALLMAMIAVALIALIALGMSVRQSLLIKRVQNTLWFEQAHQYLLGGEQLSALALKTDLEQSQKLNKPYTFDQPYLTQSFAFPLTEGGQISGTMDDLQGRFNLRNLLNEKGGQNLNATAAFDRLLRSLGLSTSLTDTMIDWMDAGLTPMPKGAEDPYYLGLEKPYLTANHPLVSIHELRKVKGFDALINQPDGKKKTVFEVLQKYVVLLPEPTPLNVNLADEKVLQSYLPHADSKKIQEIIKSRPFRDVERFKSLPLHRKANNTPVNFDLLPSFSVTTDYFVVNLSVSLGNINAAMQSILERNPKTGLSRVVSRTRGPS